MYPSYIWYSLVLSYVWNSRDIHTNSVLDELEEQLRSNSKMSVIKQFNDSHIGSNQVVDKQELVQLINVTVHLVQLNASRRSREKWSPWQSPCAWAQAKVVAINGIVIVIVNTCQILHELQHPYGFICRNPTSLFCNKNHSMLHPLARISLLGPPLEETRIVKPKL